MTTITHATAIGAEELYRLSDLRKRPVLVGARKIGWLADLMVVDQDVVAEVTHLCVHRPFGEPTLYLPWQKVQILTNHGVVFDINTALEELQGVPNGAVPLQDYIVDKKVLDVQGREVEVVYDAILAVIRIHLYVIAVDLSKRGMLRQMGLGWVARLLGEALRERTVAWDLVEPLPENIGSFAGDIKLKVVREELAKMPAADAARILETLSHDQRFAIFHKLETENASDTLEEMDPTTQRGLIAAMPKEQAARLIDLMTPGQAADILSVLPSAEAKLILELLSKRLAGKVSQILHQQEVRVADFLTASYLMLPPDNTVGQARRAYQEIGTLKAPRSYLYVVDGQGKLLGVVTAAELLRVDDDALLRDIMNGTVLTLAPDQTLKEASEMFERYNFRALPVTDSAGKLLGVVPYRDVMNLTHRYVE
ncbi:MAG: CBS domain-containing protein [Verrucomicrobiia bacterium]|jgi:CBS domain-containing protein